VLFSILSIVSKSRSFMSGHKVSLLPISPKLIISLQKEIIFFILESDTGFLLTNSHAELNLTSTFLPIFQSHQPFSPTLANTYAKSQQGNNREHFNLRSLNCKCLSHLWCPQSGGIQHAAKVCMSGNSTTKAFHFVTHSYFKPYVSGFFFLLGEEGLKTTLAGLSLK